LINIRSERWFGQVALFQKAEDVPGGKHIVFLGDSLTEGFNFKKYWPNQPLINRGIGGDYISGLTERLYSSLCNIQPKAFFILIGINDLGERSPLPEVYDDLRNLKTELSSTYPWVRQYWQSLLPFTRNEAIDWPRFKPADVMIVNTFLQTQVAESGSRFINLFDHFKDEHGGLPPALSTDGLHLSEAGYDLWAKIINPFVQAEINGLDD